MKQLSFISSIFVFLATSTAAAPLSKIDFVTRMATQINFAEKQQNLVWPGFHPAATPSIIIFIDNSVAYALNFKPGQLPWQQLEASTAASLYFLEDAFSHIPDARWPNDDVFLNVEGQKSFVDLESGFELAAQEEHYNKFMMMRATQYILNEAPIDPSNYDKLNFPFEGFNDTTLVKLLYLEDTALTQSQQAGASAETALRDAVAIHQYRLQQTTSSARDFENAMEIIFSIPAYIGLSSLQLNDNDYRKMSQRVGCAPLSAMATPFEFAGCAMHEFPIYAGTVYGRALDKKLQGKSWKQDLLSQFKSNSQVAIDYYHLTNEQARVITEQAIQKADYHYDRIERVVDKVLGKYSQKAAAAKSKYNQMTGLELRFPLMWGLELMDFAMFGSGDGISAIYYVDANTFLLENLNFGDKNNSSIFIANYKFYNFPYIAIQFKKKKLDIDDAHSWMIMKISPDTKLIIDGVTDSAAHFVNLHKVQDFQTLTIADTKFSITTKFSGKLDAADGKLKLIDHTNSPSERHVSQQLIHDLLRRPIPKKNILML